MSAANARLRITAAIVSVAIVAVCAYMFQRHMAVHKVVSSGQFTADNEFVVEMEHDGKGNPVDVSTYGPVPEGQSCEQYESVINSGASKHNPPGFRSQTTCLHVRFSGPLGVHGAVVTQPINSKPLGWALIAVAYSRMGSYIGAQTLHETPDLKTCRFQAHDIIDSNVKDGKIHTGWSALIYCLPIPPLPTEKTLPNGDSII